MQRLITIAVAVLLCAASSSAASFRRGDANQDGQFDIADAIRALGYLFGGETSTCHDALDVNDDGQVNIADPIKLLTYLFAGPEAIPQPFPNCGGDPTADSLTCAQYSGGGCAAAPRIDSITPTTGPIAGGTAVVIIGAGFQGGDLQATLCGLALTNITIVSDVRVEATTPAHAAGACTLRIVTSAGQAEIADAYTYTALRIGSVTPKTGPESGGTVLVITGEGFQGGNLHARLCSSLLTNIRILSNTRMEGTTPAHPGGGVCDLRITTNQGSATLEAAFTYEVEPPPDCYTDAELKALLEDQLGAPLCLPAPIWEGSVAGFDIVACPTQRAGTCEDGVTVGCEASMNSITPVIDYDNGKVQADITGSSELPVNMSSIFGSNQCTADVTMSGTASMDVLMEDTQWEGVRRITAVQNLAILVTEFSLSATGGGLCGSLSLAEGTMRDLLQDELDTRSAEFEAAIAETLVGQYVCP